MKNFCLILTFLSLGACAVPQVGPMPNLEPARRSTTIARKHVQDTRKFIDTGQHGLKSVDQDLTNLLK